MDGESHRSSLIKTIIRKVVLVAHDCRAVFPAPLVSSKNPRTQNESVKTVIWFGNAGAEYGKFGLSDIVEVAGHLANACTRVKFELLVVSNDEDAYTKLIQPLPFPSRYLPWDPMTIQTHIKGSNLVIIPNSVDEFAICKSSNRAVLALNLGVPVVASRTPALELFRECVVLDDWEEGIVRYLTDPEIVQAHVGKALALLNNEFSAGALAARWSEAFAIAKAVERKQSPPSPLDRPMVNLVVTLHLVQDLDLAVPVLKEGARRHDMTIRVWVTKSLLERSPRVLRTLRALHVSFTVVADDSVLDLRMIRFQEVDAVLTVAETDQRAHRIPHAITRRANAAGLLTYTMQHGFENIGLTYTDAVHPIQNVKFAAKTIFTWGPRTSLHPYVREDTKAKCIHVGCMKEAVMSGVRISTLLNAKKVIGIFENLHWHRYDQSYVERFLADCSTMATSYPDLTFLVKPHHAGQWLTSRYHGPVPVHPNLVIADPADPKWEGYTGSQLLEDLDAVITSPSTVALDAARIGKPVAVVGYDLDLSLYSPLPVICDVRQWDEFIQQISNPSSRQFLVSRSQAFAEKSLGQGKAVTRMLDTIVADHGRISTANRKQTNLHELSHAG